MELQTLQEILARGETATVKFNGRVVGVPEAAISDIQRNIANNVLRRGHYAQGLQPGADLLRGIRARSKGELKERILRYFDKVNEVPVPYRWTWGLDDIDLGGEDVDSIPFEVVNAKACRPEDRSKRAPTPPRRGRRPKKGDGQTAR